MYCKQCGKELADGTNFCGFCGARQGEGDNLSSAEVTETDKTVSVGAKEKRQQDRRKPRKGKGGLIAVLVAVVLFLVAGVVAAQYFTGDSYNIARDLKLARECFEEGEYREALSCYKDALRRDNTLTEAYLGTADVYLAQQDMEQAREELQKGLKKVRNDEEGLSLLTAKLSEVYLQEANMYADSGEYASAYSLLQEGIESTGASVLEDGKVGVYLKEAEGYIESGDTSGAMQVLRLGLENTEGASRQQELRQKEAEVYRAESDALLTQGDCLGALRRLEEGMQETGISALSERETYVRDNIICVKEVGADYQKEYDAAGNLIAETGRSGGGLEYVSQYVYDAAGRMTQESYTETKGIQTQVNYGENGRPASGSLGGRLQGYTVTGELEYDAAQDRAKWTINFNGSDYVLCREIIWVGAQEAVLFAEYDNRGYGFFCEYDVNGHLIKETYSDSEDNVNIHEYEYDAAGNQVKDKYYDNVGYGYELTMAYDASGNLIEYTGTDSNGSTEYRSYENIYDAMGNLISCTEHNGNGDTTDSYEKRYEYLYIGE